MQLVLPFIFLFSGIVLSAQTRPLTSEENQTKIELDHSVTLSKNYLKVSGYTTATAFVITMAAPNFLSLGATIAGAITTPYHLIRHLHFVKKRNAFYKEFGIPFVKKIKKRRFKRN